MGSARESRDWFYKGRHILGETVVQHRLQLLTEVIRLLLTMIPQQRGRLLREESTFYQIGLDNAQPNAITEGEELDNLLRNIPLPSP